MTLYEAIFARRSVKKYEGALLDGAELAEVKSHIDGAKQLPGQSARLEIANNDKFKGGFAPHAILAFSNYSDEALVNIGYVLQGADLWLQSRGYGSVWCGTAALKSARDDYRIMLGFGKTDVPARKSESEFKRKKLPDISNADNAVARAARLAPSAMNFQPWKLAFADGSVTISANVRGVGRIILGKVFLYDIGIITKHVEIAIENEGCAITAINMVGAGKDMRVEVIYSGKNSL